MDQLRSHTTCASTLVASGRARAGAHRSCRGSSNLRSFPAHARTPQGRRLRPCGVIQLGADVLRLHVCSPAACREAHTLQLVAEERERELQAQQQRLHERTQLANELHDSLAQTLASLKFQIRVLDDTLRQDSESAIWQEMERIESSVDEANVELRELIAHFRAPLSRHGLIPGIRRLLSRLRKETGTETVLQNQANDAELTEEEEAQILRIVQEALANVRKHSRANMVRVLLSYDNIGRLRLIVEDDGIGMVIAPDDQNSDGHFGLAIMQERAVTVGAELTIESEPGDGTRVVIELGSVDEAAGRKPLGERTE